VATPTSAPQSPKETQPVCQTTKLHCQPSAVSRQRQPDSVTAPSATDALGSSEQPGNVKKNLTERHDLCRVAPDTSLTASVFLLLLKASAGAQHGLPHPLAARLRPDQPGDPLKHRLTVTAGPPSSLSKPVATRLHFFGSFKTSSWWTSAASQTRLPLDPKTCRPTQRWSQPARVGSPHFGRKGLGHWDIAGRDASRQRRQRRGRVRGRNECAAPGLELCNHHPPDLQFMHPKALTIPKEPDG
jgi:hypothetical protein